MPINKGSSDILSNGHSKYYVKKRFGIRAFRSDHALLQIQSYIIKQGQRC